MPTKVHIPRVAGQTIKRPRLVDVLESGLPDCKLVLLAAPAGYGKTTLLSQWARTSRFQFAWLSLGEEDNHLERFLRYVFRAWEQVQPAIRESALGVMLEGSMPEVQAVLAAFINQANEAPGHIVLVLDDYHLVEEASIHQALAYLLDHLPQSLHFALSSRTDPPLPLPRYRARAEMLELRAAELQFLPEETEHYINHTEQLDLSTGELEKLQTQTEGWAAALRLVGLTQKRGQAATGTAAVTGKQRFIADYLGQEVLARLPIGMQRFLLETSILDQLCSPLCEAVTAAEDGQGMLERLERENMFLVALDDNRQWYRYHSLFADYLQEELARRHPGKVQGLHQRAALWHLEHDLPEQAYRHSLAAGDLELMRRVFDRYANAKLLAGELGDLKGWLDGLPADWLSAYPAFGLARAGYLAYTGAIEACLLVVDQVEKSLSPTESQDARQQLAKVNSVRCYMACMGNDLSQAEAYAGQALNDLPEDDLGFQPGIYAALGDTYRQNGLWVEARRCYLKALDFAQSPTVRVQSAHLYGALADLELRQGRLHSASGYWEKALASVQEKENWGRIPLPVTGWIYTRKAELLYEWNELEAAEDHLARGIKRAGLGGDLRTQTAANILYARLNLALGEVDQAASYLEQARSLAEPAAFPDWLESYERCRLDLWLAEGRLKTAVARAGEIMGSGILEGRPESVPVELGIARVWIEKGDRRSIEHAQELLERTLTSVENQGRAGLAIETIALLALTSWTQGDHPGALSFLERSLRIAEPESYIRCYVDLGLSMGRLLQKARSRGVMADYVAKLLEAYGSGLSSSVSTTPALPEPLTPREQEILELLAAGLTNREIAGEVVISPETVKKHVASISGKLGARNRTEAVARAREWDLLE